MTGVQEAILDSRLKIKKIYVTKLRQYLCPYCRRTIVFTLTIIFTHLSFHTEVKSISFQMFDFCYLEDNHVSNLKNKLYKVTILHNSLSCFPQFPLLFFSMEKLHVYS